MESLLVDKTSITPKVQLNPDNGIMEFEGRMIPEDPGEFFEPIFSWIEQYFKQPQAKSILKFKLEYVNSGSSKYILGIFKTFQDAFLKGRIIEIYWYFEEDDEAVIELGNHYQRTFKDIPYHMVEY